MKKDREMNCHLQNTSIYDLLDLRTPEQKGIKCTLILFCLAWILSLVVRGYSWLCAQGSSQVTLEESNITPGSKAVLATDKASPDISLAPIQVVLNH